MPMPRPIFVLVTSLCIALGLGGVMPAQAQLHGPPRGLPDVHLPAAAGRPPAAVHLPDPPVLPRTLPAAVILHGDSPLHGSPVTLRQLQINTLLRDEPGRVTVDPHGEPVLRSEFLALALSNRQLHAVQARGFVADKRVQANATLGLDVVVLRDTRRRSEITALQVLRQTAPKATFAYQHLYLSAGEGDSSQRNMSASGSSGVVARRVGLIDGGVDMANPALSRARIERHGCKTTAVSVHGTTVAARLVDGDPDMLYAADLWCADKVGGSTSSLVDALAWMARERVPVINISLVGPDNPILARAVQAMIARGHVLVSAVGNDGPAAPPLFPASYPGVIGVSAVDAHDRVLPESGSGSQVAFCASGVVGHGRDALRGTSFAAPIVARIAAGLLDAPRQGAAAQILPRLAAMARDLGPPGRDARCGYGLLSPQI